MKLSELSFREYIALEALPAIIAATSAGQHQPGAGYAPDGANIDARICFDAFRMADAFLKRAGREHDKIAEIKRECDKLEAQNSLLLHMNEDGQFAARVALSEIWEFLGAAHQTEAMQALRQLKAELSVAEEHPHD